MKVSKLFKCDRCVIDAIKRFKYFLKRTYVFHRQH